jgi:hypothetical protein
MSAEEPTAAELLAEVNKAILALVTKRVGRYRLGEIEYTYQTIGELRQLRTELQRELATTTNTTSGRRCRLLTDISGRAQ